MKDIKRPWQGQPNRRPCWTTRTDTAQELRDNSISITIGELRSAKMMRHNLVENSDGGLAGEEGTGEAGKAAKGRDGMPITKSRNDTG